MADYEKHVHEFPPFYEKDSTILILGSFPSVRSREQAFYYGHPQNRFWRVLSTLASEKVPEEISGKKDFLRRHGIALWDVIESCEIRGSSDASIKNAVMTDLPLLLSESPIHTIYANGKLAYRLYMKFQFPVTGRKIISLPSTSPANAACSFEDLVKAWKVIQIR